MNIAELVGGALFDAEDPEEASRRLLKILLSDAKDAALMTGFDPDLVEALRSALPTDAGALSLACLQGAAWVNGYRSNQQSDSWEPVITSPANIQMPSGITRSTAETLVGAITAAEHQVRLAVPFIDERGIGYIAEALAAASKRGVGVQVILSTRSGWTDGAVRRLETTFASEGEASLLNIKFTKPDSSWPHLKVAVVDQRMAYVGSANLTGPGLAGRNLELGVFVRGQQAHVIDQVLDLIEFDGEGQ